MHKSQLELKCLGYIEEKKEEVFVECCMCSSWIANPLTTAVFSLGFYHHGTLMPFFSFNCCVSEGEINDL